MTIRRRLYLSNILMIVLPAMICLLAVSVVSGILMNAFGITHGSYSHGVEVDFFQDTLYHAGSWAEDSSAADVAQSLAGVIEDFPQNGASLSVYRGSQLLFTHGTPIDPLISLDALVQGGDQTFTANGAVILVENIGVYTIIGVQENPMLKAMYAPAFKWQLLVLAIVALGGMVSIILLVNGLLTRMIFRHIMQPLTTLSDGVRQIAGGNLAYRIDYEGSDEFSPVMSDFNDMAAHLQEMVAARQKDDESRRELIAGISHDLRTPLTSIIGYVEGLEKGVAGTPAMQARYLATIHEQADILSHTINQLFLFTKLDTDSFPMRLERIDLAAELAAFIGLVADGYADRGLRIRLAERPGAAVFVFADRLQLRNVLTNILENSAKYGNRQDNRMEITCEAAGRSAVITLTDNGPGVAEASLEKLFTVFYRSDASRHNIKDGSGLGLAISARIVRRLGGAITAANAAPQGLSIRITLPRAEEEQHAEDTDHRG